MFIRSQNKASLINSKSLHIAEKTNNETEKVDFAIVEMEAEYRIDLGVFETKSRAIKVLDEIQNAIWETERMKLFPQDGFVSPIYQMPEK